MSKEVDESRRNFLKASGLGAVAVAVAGTGLGRIFSDIFQQEDLPDRGEEGQDGGSRSGEIVEGKPL